MTVRAVFTGGIRGAVAGGVLSYAANWRFGRVVLSPQLGALALGLTAAFYQKALPWTRHVIWGGAQRRFSTSEEFSAKTVAFGITVCAVAFVLKLAEYIPSIPFPVKILGALSGVGCGLAKVGAWRDENSPKTPRGGRRQLPEELQPIDKEAIQAAQWEAENCQIVVTQGTSSTEFKTLLKNCLYHLKDPIGIEKPKFNVFRVIWFRCIPEGKGREPFSFKVVWNPRRISFEMVESTDPRPACNDKLTLLIDSDPALLGKLNSNPNIEDALPENIAQIFREAETRLGVPWVVRPLLTLASSTIRIIDGSFTALQGR